MNVKCELIRTGTALVVSFGTVEGLDRAGVALGGPAFWAILIAANFGAFLLFDKLIDRARCRRRSRK